MNQGGVSKALNQFQKDEYVKDTTNHTKIMDYKNIFNHCKNSEMILKICNLINKTSIKINKKWI